VASAKSGFLFGYPSEWSVAPGTALPVMVSTNAPSFTADLVRLIHGDANPLGPGFKEEVIDSLPPRGVAGRVQETEIGSYAEVPHALAVGRGFELDAWIFPTLLTDGPQGIITSFDAAGRGFGLSLVRGGLLELRAGGFVLRTEEPLQPRRWYRVLGAVGGGVARVEARPAASWTASRALTASGATGEVELEPEPPASLLIGAGFDGKIAQPQVAGEDGELLASWEFQGDWAADDVRDASGNERHGRLVNRPTRAVTGPGWSGSELDYRRAPEQYDAIHFHHDDVDDSGWEPSFQVDLPPTLKSGIYAVRLTAPGLEDRVPFFVRPPAGAAADVLFLVPTFTYLAYGNERMAFDEEADWGALLDHPVTPDPLEHVVRDHPGLGSSLYDRHADGSGVCYASRRRPILNMRPSYRNWVTRAPRHLSGDLYFIDWLEQKGLSYAVATDEDLHAGGADVLEPYPVVVTGSHPEYVTGAMRAGIEGYLQRGGRLLYLGGNGLYWVTSVHPDRPDVIEVRRGHAGTRCWESAAGENHHATTGEPGGLWRHRGLPPDGLVGVGFSGQGSGVTSPGFSRLPASYDERFAPIFAGVEEPVIGEFGLAMGGAAGDELDRFDPALAGPIDATVLATSAGRHSSYYLVAHETQLLTGRSMSGDVNPDVRADMTYVAGSESSAVFSVGSINWFGSLSHNGYDNSVSRVTENVIRLFASTPRGEAPID
jgi:N,N-dimethylformamidase